MSGDPDVIRRFFTLFSVLGAVVAVGGIYALTSHRTSDRIGAARRVRSESDTVVVWRDDVGRSPPASGPEHVQNQRRSLDCVVEQE
jgi:hypothetical protein